MDKTIQYQLIEACVNDDGVQAASLFTSLIKQSIAETVTKLEKVVPEIVLESKEVDYDKILNFVFEDTPMQGKYPDCCEGDTVWHNTSGQKGTVHSVDKSKMRPVTVKWDGGETSSHYSSELADKDPMAKFIKEDNDFMSPELVQEIKDLGCCSKHEMYRGDNVIRKDDPEWRVAKVLNHDKKNGKITVRTPTGSTETVDHSMYFNPRAD